MSRRPAILIVDDNPNDVELLGMALEEGGVEVDVRSLMDGRAAIIELGRLAGQRRDAWPDLVVLDLNMPITNGHEVLAHVAGDVRLRGLPIVVLTTSTSPEDRRRCEAMGAAAYVVKPRRFAEFAGIVDRLRPFLDPDRRAP
ncbi:MAG TPA: response regulator [Planctomycetota bacterium]|nr:response regulator [Planctomycetota bacterium]